MNVKKYFTLTVFILLVLKLFGQSGFIENRGQLHDEQGKSRKDIQFLFRNGNFQIQIKETGISYELFIPEKSEIEGKSQFRVKRIDLDFIDGDSNLKWEGEKELPQWENYYNQLGEFRHVKIFERVRVTNIWDGVDLIFYVGSEGAPKYDFIVHGNKLDRIKLKVSNAEELKVAEQLLFMKLGELEISDIIGPCYSETNPEFNLNFNWKLSDNILSFSSDRLLNNSEIYRIDPQILLGLSA